jgi:hypothetical protein
VKKVLILLFSLLLSIYISACVNGGKTTQPPEGATQQKTSQTTTQQTVKQTDQQTAQQTADNDEASLMYKNTQYGFRFTLPAGWQGYSIITEKWEGLAIGGTKEGQLIETGPLLSIRHPKWSDKKPRQDIPIMVFTLKQWKELQQEKFHIGAAPIGPKELGRNSKYVFALPARYNFAFPEGFEEVEKIIESKPLQAE